MLSVLRGCGDTGCAAAQEGPGIVPQPSFLVGERHLSGTLVGVLLL